MLAYHTEFQGEPEDLRDEFQRLSRLHTPNRLSGQPVQSRETIMSQAIAVADHLVDQIGLWRVERHGVVPDVLGGVENSVC